MIDIHAHILPGIDDGAETLADSVAMVRELAEQGVTDVIATPHYVNETIYTSPRGENLRLLEELKRELTKEGVGVNVYLGNEIYINEQVTGLIRAGEMSRLADSEYVLVELPMSGEYPNYLDVLLGIKEDGYKVILAHPERYVAIQHDYAKVQELDEAGILLQCNLGSLAGQYGKRAKKTVVKLLREGRVFAFGSDIHHLRGEDYWEQVQKKLQKYCDSSERERILVENPRKIVGR